MNAKLNLHDFPNHDVSSSVCIKNDRDVSISGVKAMKKLVKS